MIEGEVRRHGVDTSWVRWVPDARLGLMFYQPGPEPRVSRVISTTENIRPHPNWPSRMRPGRA
jgi:hypothetical protein